MRHLIGLVSFGNLPFLELALRGIQETLTRSADVLVVVAKADDSEMRQFLDARHIRYIQNEENKGFAGSINDIFEYGWVQCDYDTITIQGNDVIPYPGALDGMIEAAETTDWEWLCASQFDSKSLVARYPETRQFFRGDNLEFTDFDSRPWEIHKDFRTPEIEPDSLKDVRNLAMFKRSVFEKIGYADVNFWPNAFFEDNDAARRANAAGVKSCGLSGSAYFHFWSRTIHQGVSRPHAEYFNRNGGHYVHKWGGPVGGERYSLPFDGREFELAPGLVLTGDLRIGTREQEAAIIDFWSTR